MKPPSLEVPYLSRLKGISAEDESGRAFGGQFSKNNLMKAGRKQGAGGT